MQIVRKRKVRTRRTWKCDQPTQSTERHRQIPMRRMPRTGPNPSRERNRPTRRIRRIRIDLMQIRATSPQTIGPMPIRTAERWKCESAEPESTERQSGKSNAPMQREPAIEVSRTRIRRAPTRRTRRMRRIRIGLLRTSRMQSECTNANRPMRRIRIDLTQIRGYESPNANRPDANPNTRMRRIRIGRTKSSADHDSK